VDDPFVSPTPQGSTVRRGSGEISSTDADGVAGDSRIWECHGDVCPEMDKKSVKVASFLLDKSNSRVILA